MTRSFRRASLCLDPHSHGLWEVRSVLPRALGGSICTPTGDVQVRIKPHVTCILRVLTQERLACVHRLSLLDLDKTLSQLWMLLALVGKRCLWPHPSRTTEPSVPDSVRRVTCRLQPRPALPRAPGRGIKRACAIDDVKRERSRTRTASA